MAKNTLILDLLKGKARYSEGQRWQQKSGQWVEKKNGKIVKIKKGRKKKAVDQVAEHHAAAAHEEDTKKIKKVKEDAKKKPKPKTGKTKGGGKKKPTDSYHEELKRHKELQQAADAGKSGGGEGAGSVPASTGDSGGEVSSGSYNAGGKEILVARSDLTQKPQKNYLPNNILKALHKHQQDSTNLAIEQYDSGASAFFNADGTGAGKSRQILALAAHYAPKESEPVLIVTKNAGIISGSFTDDAKAMGLSINQISHPDEMKQGAINICTYAALPKFARRVSVADEKLGELAKEAWKYKTADEFVSAIGAGDITAQAAYNIFGHTGYEKGMQVSYAKNPDGFVKQVFTDFYNHAHGKNRKINFQWSAKALRRKIAMGEVARNVSVSDAKKTGLVMFDEAHEMKNADSGQADNGLAMMSASGKVGMFTATPLDKPEHIHYLCHAFKLDYNKVLSYCGYNTDAKGNVKSTNMPLETRMNAVSNIFMNLTHNGQMVKREVSLKNMALQAHMVDMDQSDQRAYNEAESFWEDRVAAAGGGPAAMNVAGQMTLAMRRLNESFKVKHVVSKAINDLKAGKQAILFFDNVGEKGKNFKLHKESKVEYGSSVERAHNHLQEELKKHPELAHVKIAEYHGQMTNGARKKSKADFQSGNAHVFITSPRSGGTGINLDDITGNAPRSVHIATAPYSANEFIQMLGRGNRVTTKSKLDVHLHISDTTADDKNVHALINKTKTLGAAVSGDYEGLKVPDKSVAKLPGMEGAEEIGDQWDQPNRPFIKMNMDNFKKDMIKSFRHYLLGMVEYYAAAQDMFKAYASQVGPQGGHYHVTAAGNKVYESEMGRHFHNEISQSNHPDIVTNHVLKMDSMASKGQLPSGDMEKLMGHAANRMQLLMNAKKGSENKKREARKSVIMHKRQTIEGGRKGRKMRSDARLKRRIKQASDKVQAYKEKSEKLKQAHSHFMAHRDTLNKKLAELQPHMDQLKAQAEKLRHYKDTMPATHPQYPNLIAAIKKHTEKAKAILPHYNDAKKSMAETESKLQRILELHNKSRGVIRAYTKAAREDIDTMRKSLLSDVE